MIKFGKKFISTNKYHSKVLILGGGDGGISIANLLKNSGIRPDEIRIIDNNRTYTYQSGLTLVASNIKSIEKIKTDKLKRLSSNIAYEESIVDKIFPKENTVITKDKLEYTYDVLVISAGIKPDYDKIKGLREALNNKECPVGSLYTEEYALKFQKLLKSFKGGNAIFTKPNTFYKCGGAPLKILFLSCEQFQKNKIPNQTEFMDSTGQFFGVKYYSDELVKIAENYNVKINYFHELIEVNSEKSKAYFKISNTGEIVEKPFDLLSVTPPHSAPQFIENSGLSNSNGLCNVSHETLQQKTFPNIFSLGDCADLPTSKTLSAVNEQIHIANNNILSFLQGKEFKSIYNGYTACPILVGNKKIMLCEFGYNGKLLHTFLKNQSVPRKIFYHLKVHLFDKISLYGLGEHIQMERQAISKVTKFLKFNQ